MSAPPLPLHETKRDSLSNLTSAGISPILYEVNLSVPKENARDYLSYLGTFCRNAVETVEGFTHCNVFTQPKPTGLHWLSEEGDAKVYVVVQYHIASEHHMNLYLDNYQDALSKQDQNKWGFLVISRRILRLQVAI
ncbi:hypothetical protein HDU78_003958 [Chytriomyces hyalinus]|uniref:ABM domain-containing protein n=1 Tax=Chytriomyces confervae TaxID=246404 RepID=A0A507FJM2_9FUNG|nr:hypothetical protein HDU78_003958 [Chytriomyces hyalinus]KAJ3266531.1 hypothetical protein HDU77_000632 [Chytriomyces hyalinus]KAJ3406507.1 hypothetical protein HDU80_011106 [Chytriomyces hyalinus]TPX75506.1 hypothetical protein CcCBS67573_g03225 [Chytriomyces confervae]